MSTSICRECGQEGYGPWAHTSRCAQQKYQRPVQTCPGNGCAGYYLKKGQELCENCVAKVGVNAPSTPRRFKLIRTQDHSGVSGTGYVADGVQFWTGVCVLVWRTKFSSVNVYDSLDNVLQVHGHEGSTSIEWID